MRRATNIQWSTNDSHALESLPTEIEIPVGMEEDAISDYLSEQTGYLHEGYVLEQDMKETHRVFIDMDGTLYAFHDDILDDEGAVQIEKMYEKDFFLKLKPFQRMHEALVLLHNEPEVEVYILSSADRQDIVDQKIEVIQRDFGFIDRDHMLFPKTWENKADAIPDGIKRGDLLIDDYNVNLEAWERADGLSTKFVNNINNKALGRYGGDKGNLWKGNSISYQDPPEKIATNLLQYIRGARYQCMLKYPIEALNKTIMQKTLEQFGEWNMCEKDGQIFVAHTGDLDKDIHFDYEYMVAHCDPHDDVRIYANWYAEVLDIWIEDIRNDINDLGVLDEQGNYDFYLTEQELEYCGLKEEYENVKQENERSNAMEPELDEIEM